MKRIKAKLLEISDKIHADDMEYMTYTRDEFIKELDENITSLSAAKDYLKAILESILKETQEEFDRYGDMEVLVYQTECAEMLDCLCA